jgi:hypothetical protein
MRSEIPPPGPAMTFDAWSRAIVAGVRRYLPDARAARKGPRLVIIRYGELEARLVDDGGAFCISFRAGDSAVTMSGLVDRDRRDSYTQRDHINIYGFSRLSNCIADRIDGVDSGSCFVFSRIVRRFMLGVIALVVVAIRGAHQWRRYIPLRLGCLSSGQPPRGSFDKLTITR